ncbi:Threonine/homoserine/homoserine lactone efflux protein [Ferrimonas sediminum]|uniref:Threonine/homoserine/homoserine lactone efflux protein n=1 Tax=Ferrimonas sediminum TaxID=718193 RepID=A0A1G9B1N6_9GAMM|nr:LysE family translocator [Ferrimonas sediminum]SDK32735.1 Threonine/homoserine/homoserine lactone efflux protein [Ferrimonas sediminum]
MTFLTWLPLATVCVLGAISPGPSLALVINNTVQRGTATGLRTALGHGIGVALYALITAMGLGLLISQTPWLFDAIRYAGAAFLVYMAIKILRARPAAEGEGTLRKNRFVGFGGGFMVAFLNPKLAIFFLALFSQFVRADLTLGDQLLMMATAGGIDALWYAAVALGIGRTGLLGWLQRHGIWVDRASAVIFLLLATAVLLQ